MLTVTNVVHPNTNDGRPGYRFGVYLTDGPTVDVTDLTNCLNAGWRDDADAALLAGAEHAATARGAIRAAADRLGLPVPDVDLVDQAADVDYFPAPPN